MVAPGQNGTVATSATATTSANQPNHFGERTAAQNEQRGSGEEHGVDGAESEVRVPLHCVHASYCGGVEAVSARREGGTHHRRVAHNQHGQSRKSRAECRGRDPASAPSASRRSAQSRPMKMMNSASPKSSR